VSAGQWLKQLGDLSHVTFSVRAKWKNSPQIESQLEALELSYLLTMLKNDSMNLIFGHMISYDCCYHHHMNVIGLWLYVIALVIISEQDFGYVSNKGSHFRWRDPRAALPTGSEQPVAVTFRHHRP
jgi:hypothetical protein